MFAVSDQVRMFLATVLTGVILAAAFDWHRAWRAALRPRGWGAHALDFAFVPLGALIVAGGLLAANWGDLRAYAFAGLALGAWAYARLASPILLPVEVGAARHTLAAGRAMVRLALWPYRLGRRAGAGAMRLGHRAAGLSRRVAGKLPKLPRWPSRPTPPPDD